MDRSVELVNIMKNNVVYFAHGKESGPWGIKIKKLAEVAKGKGFTVESPDYSTTVDPDERVKMLLDLNPKAGKNLVLVGSSMGGYVSAVASKELNVSGMFLLAPAFYRAGYAQPNPKPCAQRTLIIHGWDDKVIPVENSVRYAKEHKTELYLLKSDHRLLDVLSEIEKIFGTFLDNVL